MVRTYKAIIEIDDDECACVSAANVQHGIADKGAVIRSWDDITPAQTVAAPVEVETVKDEPWPSWLPPVSEAPEWAVWMTIEWEGSPRVLRCYWWLDKPFWEPVQSKWYHQDAKKSTQEQKHKKSIVINDLPTMSLRDAIWRIPGR